MNVRWEQSRECPCLYLVQEQVSLGLGDAFAPAVAPPKVPSTKQSRADCPDCHGKGIVWFAPQIIPAYLSNSTSAELMPDWTSVAPKVARRIRTRDQEFIPTGEMKFTLLPEHLPSLGDRYSLIRNIFVRKETHFYTGEAVSRLHHAIRVTELDTDPVMALGVTSCFVVGADLDVAESGEERVEGDDFTVEPDGSGIRWINPPETNGRFSVTYYGIPRYIVTEIPHSFRDHWQSVKLPAATVVRDVVQVVCKQEALAGPNADSTGGNG